MSFIRLNTFKKEIQTIIVDFTLTRRPTWTLLVSRRIQQSSTFEIYCSESIADIAQRELQHMYRLFQLWFFVEKVRGQRLLGYRDFVVWGET